MRSLRSRSSTWATVRTAPMGRVPARRSNALPTRPSPASWQRAASWLSWPAIPLRPPPSTFAGEIRPHADRGHGAGRETRLPGDPQRGSGGAGHRTEPRRRTLSPHGGQVRRRRRPRHGTRPGLRRTGRKTIWRRRPRPRPPSVPPSRRCWSTRADQIVLAARTILSCCPSSKRVLAGRGVRSSTRRPPSPAASCSCRPLRPARRPRPPCGIYVPHLCDEAYRLRLERKAQAYGLTCLPQRAGGLHSEKDAARRLVGISPAAGYPMM